MPYRESDSNRKVGADLDGPAFNEDWEYSFIVLDVGMMLLMNKC